MIIYKVEDTGFCEFKINFSTHDTMVNNEVKKELKKGNKYRFIKSVGKVNNRKIHSHVKVFFKDDLHFVEFLTKKFNIHFEKIKTPPPLTRHITNEVRLK